MQLPEGVVLDDSLGDIKPENTNPILVCGSHCGGNRELAKQVKSCNFKAVFLNSAGVGKNDAGTKGLAHYNAEEIIACAVDQNSAEIGIAQDTWECGVISHINAKAESAGINVGDSVQEAVSKISNTSLLSSTKPDPNTTQYSTEEKDNKTELKKQSQLQIDGVEITVTDSITFLNEENAGDIVVCGSHGGMSAGHYAKKHNVKAVIFNDAGIGKNNAGTKSLDFLNDVNILACTVDCMSAEIFNGRDILENGIISVCNQQAKSKGISEGISVKVALKLI